ncbi:hypothetical protein B0H16DRAFT_1561494 [Mycena metata]|uniref:SnoaL-like domain-containing protein n=1 Tax=Mycena metata TaxID=1033252 RepID=A0AAD7IHN0_9AGAR|nr:hypothetical protein B0H16DRAFT_1561494 [Mycena metata]
MVALRFTSLFLLCTSFTALATNLPYKVTAPKGTSTLPSLTEWTKNFLTAVVAAPSEDAANAGFDAYLADNVTISYNDMVVARADYVAMRVAHGFPPTTVTVNQTIEVPTVANSSQAGIVSVFFTAAIGSQVAIASMDLVIKQDTSLRTGPGCDHRRIYGLTQVQA